MVLEGLHRRRTGQERFAGVIDVPQGAAPENRVFTRFIDSVVNTCNQRGFVVAEWRAKAIAGIVQPVSHTRVVGGIFAVAKGFVEISGVPYRVDNRRIDPEM